MKNNKDCNYEGGNEPCVNCPRLMSQLYRCGYLQQTIKEVQIDLAKETDNENN